MVGHRVLEFVPVVTSLSAMHNFPQVTKTVQVEKKETLSQHFLAFLTAKDIWLSDHQPSRKFACEVAVS